MYLRIYVSIYLSISPPAKPSNFLSSVSYTLASTDTQARCVSESTYCLLKLEGRWGEAD